MTNENKNGKENSKIKKILFLCSLLLLLFLSNSEKEEEAEEEKLHNVAVNVMVKSVNFKGEFRIETTNNTML